MKKIKQIWHWITFIPWFLIATAQGENVSLERMYRGGYCTKWEMQFCKFLNK